MKNHIFLDIDGVLCTTPAALLQPNVRMPLHIPAMYYMNELCKVAEPEIVITSTNRLYQRNYSAFIREWNTLKAAFRHLPSANTFTVTPSLNSRAEEIQAYIKADGKVQNYVVIDDNSDDIVGARTQDEFRIPKERFVLTQTYRGFDFDSLAKSLAALNLLEDDAMLTLATTLWRH